jgi:hypothetical protein
MKPLEMLSLAIARIKEPRLFATERGYQGMLVAEIDKLIEAEPNSIERPVVEQEYQKTADRHGITLWPDIVVHVPFERGVSPTRRHDNHLVILLKLRATKSKANEDFKNLEIICSTLDYPCGAFVNVASSNLFLPSYTRESNKNFTLYEVAVCLHGAGLKLLTSSH